MNILAGTLTHFLSEDDRNQIRLIFVNNKDLSDDPLVF